MHQLKYLLFIPFISLGLLQADWTTTPTTIDSGNLVTPTYLVADTEGNVTAGWYKVAQNNAVDAQVAFFSVASQEWEPPQFLVSSDSDLAVPKTSATLSIEKNDHAIPKAPPDGFIPGVQVIVDAFGTVTSVWVQYAEDNVANTLFASRSTKGGPWTTPVILSGLFGSDPTTSETPLSMVVDKLGNVTIAWFDFDLTTSKAAIGAAGFTANINVAPTIYPFLDGPSPNAQTFPQLVVDALGYVTAVWEELLDAGPAVQAARLNPFNGLWTAAVNLEGSTPNANFAITPQMVVDGSGVVTVVWGEGSETTSIQTARFNPGPMEVGGSWTTYTNLAPALSNACTFLNPGIIVDENGSVTIVALDDNFLVWPSSFAAGTSSWTYPSVPLSTGAVFAENTFKMVVDNSGIVTILWAESNAYLQASRGFSSSWGPTQTLDGGNLVYGPLQVVIDKNGTVTAAWIEELEDFSLQTAQFLTTGTLWSDAVTISNGIVTPRVFPQMVVGPSGALTIVWEQIDPVQPSSIQASRLIPEASLWTPPVTLDNGLQTPNALPGFANNQINMIIDNFENVTVTWIEFNGSQLAIQAARFSAAPTIEAITPNQGPTAGGSVVTITGANFNGVEEVLFGSVPALFILNSNSQITAFAPPENSGVVDITIVTSSGTSTISENDQFTYYNLLPPVNLVGFQIEKRCEKHKNFVNILTWNPPPSQDPAAPIQAYRIYEGCKANILVGVVPAGYELLFEKRECRPRKRYTYSVVSVDIYGAESIPVFVTIH